MTHFDTRAVRSVGLAFVAIAAALLFTQLALPASWVVVGVAVAGMVATLKGARGDVPWVFPVGLALAACASSLMWFATKDPAQLIGIAATTIALGVVAARTQQLWAVVPGGSLTEKGRLPALVTWVFLGLSSAALIGAGYFHLFTLHVDSDARRLVLSFAWILLAVIFLLISRVQNHLAARDAGFVVLALAVAKILVYDSTHLDGFLRIGVFAGAGALLFLFGSLEQKRLLQ